MRGALVLLAALGSSSAHAQARRPVVVELFSSEGCSSCPPADAVLRTLDQDQPIAGAQVIALEFHIDYWNRLGWADPFSSPAFTQRQGDYSSALGAGVYTPQAVVDGAAETVGSRDDALRSLIAEAAKRPAAAVVLVRQGDSLRVKVDQASGDAEVWLAVTETGLATDVPRGENAGEHLAHGPVVRAMRKLGTLNHGAFDATASAALPAGVNAANARFVILVQQKNSGRVLGAAMLAAK